MCTAYGYSSLNGFFCKFESLVANKADYQLTRAIKASNWFKVLTERPKKATGLSDSAQHFSESLSLRKFDYLIS